MRRLRLAFLTVYRRLCSALLDGPFEIPICLILIAVQGWALLTREPPSPVLGTLPPWLWRGYEGVLLLGALLVVQAAMWTNRLTAEALERAGLWMLFTSFAVFALVILDVAGPSAILGVGTYLALAWSCQIRIYKIRKVRRIIDEAHGE